MARARRAEDWGRDLAGARAGEAAFARLLAADPRIENLQDHTEAFDRLDFSFTYSGLEVSLDLKQKRQPYTATYRKLWPDPDPEDLFILDETVYRRIVWQGGGGYLAVHDLPGGRWCIFGPWELTLGPRVRYQRWGEGAGGRFLKGKLLLDLASAAASAKTFSVDDLIAVIEHSRADRDAVEAVAGPELPEIG